MTPTERDRYDDRARLRGARLAIARARRLQLQAAQERADSESTTEQTA